MLSLKNSHSDATSVAASGGGVAGSDKPASTTKMGEDELHNHVPIATIIGVVDGVRSGAFSGFQIAFKWSKLLTDFLPIFSGIKLGRVPTDTFIYAFNTSRVLIGPYFLLISTDRRVVSPVATKRLVAMMMMMRSHT